MNIENNCISELRRSLEHERDVIDGKLALLDQYEALEGAPAKPVQPRPPPGSLKLSPSKKKEPSTSKKKKVVSRRKVAKPTALSPTPKKLAPVPQKRTQGRAKTRLADQPQTPCGEGKLMFVEGSNMDKVIAVIGSLSPHWTSHDGIVEAARAIHPAIPTSFNSIVVSVCARLREGKYAVPGLEYRIADRRVEYRMTKRIATKKED